MAGIQRRLTCNCPKGSPFHWNEDFVGRVQWLPPKYSNRAEVAKASLDKRKASGEDVSIPMAKRKGDV